MAIIQRLKSFAVPFSFCFVDPDNGHKYLANTKRELFEQIISYREQNRLDPIMGLEYVLENYWCSLPENAGKCRHIVLKRGWLQYVRGGVALLENVFYGEDGMVGDEEAERRAQICVKCPHNVFPDKGPFLAWSDSLAEAATGGRRTASYDTLGSCEACQCPLRAKIWYKGELKLSEKEKEVMRGVGCWQVDMDRK